MTDFNMQNNMNMQNDFTMQNNMDYNQQFNMQHNEQEKKFPKPGPIAAIVVIILELMIFMFLMVPAQYYLGMWGLVITELSLVIIALVAAWVVDLDIKEMLRIKRLKVNEFFGTIIMWIATLLFVMIVNLGLFYFFPEGMNVNESLNEFTSRWPIIPTLFVIAVMPAICEELLQRGFIQRCMMRKMKSRIFISIIMGLFFGIFHMDFYRFLGTAILGGVMSYILVVTDNFFYNMLFHFVNNFSVQLLSYILSKMPSEATESASTAITKEMLAVSFASYLFIGCVAPLLMFGGALLVKGKRKIVQEGKKRFFAGLIVSVALAAIMAIGSIILMAYFIMNGYYDAAMSDMGMSLQ